MKPEDLSGFHVGWDSWTRTSKAGVKVPCVTVTPYPNTVLLYAVYRLLSVYHVSPRLSIQRLARRGGQLFRECLAVPRAQHRSAAAIGRAAVSPAGRGGLLFSASDFRTRDPAASPAARGQADDALFSRVAAFFSRRAAPLPIHAFLQLRRRIYIDKKRLLRYNIRYKTVPWR